MQHDAIAKRSFPKSGYVFIAIAVASYFLMRYLSKGLSTSTIVDFELAKTVDRATAIMNVLGHEGKEKLLASIHADFLFIIGYSITLYYTAQWMGHLSGNTIFKKAGYFFSWLALIAGICDVMENGGMIYTLLQKPVAWLVHFTYDMAVVKFSLIFIVLLFIVICFLFWLIDRFTGQKMKIKIHDNP